MLQPSALVQEKVLVKLLLPDVFLYKFPLLFPFPLLESEPELFTVTMCDRRLLGGLISCRRYREG